MGRFIRKSARAVKYWKSIAAGLRGVGTKIIELIIPDVSNSFIPEITTDETIAHANGYWVTLAHGHQDYNRNYEQNFCQYMGIPSTKRADILLVAQNKIQFHYSKLSHFLGCWG